MAKKSIKNKNVPGRIDCPDCGNEMIIINQDVFVFDDKWELHTMLTCKNECGIGVLVDEFKFLESIPDSLKHKLN